jgi:hypothetical protein
MAGLGQIRPWVFHRRDGSLSLDSFRAGANAADERANTSAAF